MKSASLCPAALGVCLTFLALSAGAQTVTGNASPAATGSSTMAHAASTHKHHAMAHHQTHAKHMHTGARASGSNQDEAYRSALKSCVAGPQTQRDGCLDDAIARFGHS